MYTKYSMMFLKHPGGDSAVLTATEQPEGLALHGSSYSDEHLPLYLISGFLICCLRVFLDE